VLQERSILLTVCNKIQPFLKIAEVTYGLALKTV
jgi:hypothetical protein